MGRTARLLAVLSGPAWVAGALVLSRVDVAVGWVPGLLILRGPVGIGLALLACGVSVAHLFSGRLPPLRLGSRALFAAASAVYLLLGVYYARGLRVSGDEPHYLLMTQSLLREGDLDLRDNFARADYREYLPELPGPHYAAPRQDGRPYPGHSPGLPVLLAPAYAVGGRLACVALMALCAGLLTAQIHRLAERQTSVGPAAFFAWTAAAGPPVLFYAFHLYTEVPSALALVVCLGLLLEPGAPWRAGLAGLLAAALPWLHLKMAPAAVALALVAVVRQRGAARVAFVAVAAVMAMAFLGYYAWVFGHPTPLAVYGGVPRDMNGSALLALGGLVLDRSFGLLMVAPVFLLAVPGLVGLARRGGWPHLLVGAAVVAPLVGWRMWWGGQCPPARFLVPLVPLLAVALAVRAAATPRGLTRWRWALVALGAGVALVMIARPESMLLLNRRDRPTRVWDALSPEGVAIDRYLPSLVSASADEACVALLWLVALGSLLLLDRVAQREDRIDRLFRGLGLPLLMLLAISLGVDYWAR
jgi:hypothetical protein